MSKNMKPQANNAKPQPQQAGKPAAKPAAQAPTQKPGATGHKK